MAFWATTPVDVTPEVIVCDPDLGVSPPNVLRQLDAWLKATLKN